MKIIITDTSDNSQGADAVVSVSGMDIILRMLDRWGITIAGREDRATEKEEVMWNAYKKWHRLKNAMSSRGLNPENFSLDRFGDVLEKRGMTDQVMNGMVHTLIGYLEPR